MTEPLDVPEISAQSNLSMTDLPQLETIGKEPIRQRSKQLTERIKLDVRLVESSFVAGSNENMELRGQVMEHCMNDTPKLDAHQRGLVFDYVMRELAVADSGDQWLDRLPALTFDKLPPRQHHAVSPFMRFMVFISPLFSWIGKLFGLFGASLPDPEVMKQRTEWNRQNRGWLKPFLGGSFMVGLSFASLIWELHAHAAHPNWTAPLILGSISLLMTLFGINCAPSSEYEVRGGKPGVVFFALRSAIFSAIVGTIATLLPIGNTGLTVAMLCVIAFISIRVWIELPPRFQS